MKKSLVLYAFFCCAPLIAYAQKSGTLKGILIDTLNGLAVTDATVSILDRKDSSLVSFSLSDNKGAFDFTNPGQGQYRLLVTHTAYQNTNLQFSISDEKKDIDLGNINMIDRKGVLQEVVVKAEVPPVSMNGDTIQYHAGSFKTSPNASVEQLLKKLPGVQVDKDGTIKAQGEKVTRVLVDGKEFFGKDPKLATKNLAADIVDNIQVYNKQSDQAQLTGFEDNNYERTINLKLKENKKKGVFGELAAGAGSQNRFAAKGTINAFKDARQISVLAMGNNINEDAFTFSNMFGIGAPSPRAGNGGGTNPEVSPQSTNAATGISQVLGTGINYNNIIGKKLDWQSSLFVNRYDPSVQTYLERQNISAGANSYYSKEAKEQSYNSSGRFNSNALYQIDSTQALRLTTSFSYQDTKNNSISNFTTRLGDGSRMNDGTTLSRAENRGVSSNTDLMYWKRFRKPGRTLSLLLQNTISNTGGTNELYTHLNYYNTGNTTQRSDTIDQHSSSKNRINTYSIKATYSEPVGKKSLLEISANQSTDQNTAQYATYDFNNSSGIYDLLNQQQSGNFDNKYSYSNGGLRFRRQERKYNYAIGLGWQQAALKGTVMTGAGDSIIRKEFYNFLPSARFQYNFTKNKRLVFSYTTSTQQPTAQQLQPTADLSDALNIRYGNPDLKQELVHNMNANLFLVNPFTNKNFFLFFSLQATQHKIVNYDSLDLQTGQRYTRPVNVNNVYHYFGAAHYSFPVHFLGAQMDISNTVRYDIDKAFINGSLNTIKTRSIEPSLRLDMSPREGLDVVLAGRWNVSNSNYSVQSASNSSYLSQIYEAGFDWQFPFGFLGSTEFKYMLNNDLGEGFTKAIPLWNMSISKLFLKNNRGMLKIKAFDLLNRNTDISRSTSQNYIEDQRTDALRQYFMLSFTYSLSKTGLSNRKNNGRQAMLR